MEAGKRKEIANLLPGVLDAIVATMETGAGFDHAAFVLSKTSDDALSRALGQYVADMRAAIQDGWRPGVRRDALTDMARRIDVPEVTTFVHVVIQADQLGVRMVDVLRTLSARMAALNEVEADLANLHAAWQWAVQRKDYQAIGGALDTLYWFYRSRRRVEEGEALFGEARALLAPQPGEEPHPVWAKIVARYPDPAQDRRAQIERCLTLARERGDEAEIAFCLYALGNVLVEVPSPSERDLEEAVVCYEESLSICRALEDRFCIAEVLARVAHCHLLRGRQEDASELARQSLDLSRETGDQPGRVGFPFIPLEECDNKPE